jgi:hypothetical protein
LTTDLKLLPSNTSTTQTSQGEARETRTQTKTRSGGTKIVRSSPRGTIIITKSKEGKAITNTTSISSITYRTPIMLRSRISMISHMITIRDITILIATTNLLNTQRTIIMEETHSIITNLMVIINSQAWLRQPIQIIRKDRMESTQQTRSHQTSKQHHLGASISEYLTINQLLSSLEQLGIHMYFTCAYWAYSC